MCISIKHRNFIRAGLIIIFSLLFIADAGYSAKKNKKNESFVITEVELQSKLMSFADRFFTKIVQAFKDYDAKAPSPQRRRIVVGDTTYAMASAFTIATETNPAVALLDMLAMVTLGRIIYEEHWQKIWGSEVHPIFFGFRKAEVDIWEIASTILQPKQQQELRFVIREWRKKHPNVKVFTHIRFSDFAAERRKSKLLTEQRSTRILKSVARATQQAEKMLLLAERGKFLATRMPLLTGFFADVWLSQLVINPDANRVLNNINQFSSVSERFATVAEGLFDDIAEERQNTILQLMKEVDTLSQTTLDRTMAKVKIEREAAIKQIVEEFSNIQKNIILGFIAEEERVRGVLTELRQTLLSGNDLLVSTDSLLEKLNVGTPSEAPSRPFDIKDYRDTVAEVSNTAQELTTLVISINQLLTSSGLDQSLPKIDKAVNQVGDIGKDIINHSFRQGVLLLVIWMVVYIVAKVIINYIPKQRSQTIES